MFAFAAHLFVPLRNWPFQSLSPINGNYHVDMGFGSVMK
jgi:hypothetical protein